MKRVYLDTSAFIKLFVEEQDGETVQGIAFLANQNKITIVLSDWVLNESVGVVAKKFRKGWSIEKKLLKYSPILLTCLKV